MQQVVFTDLGLINYKLVWDRQEQLLQQNVAIKAALRNTTLALKEYPTTTHYCIFCEHNPVYTLGKSGNMANVLLSEMELEEKQIQFFKINRGGDITYHGPGQIVGYPILDLEKFYTDIGLYLRNIEEVVIRTLAEYSIVGQRSQGETGVWILPNSKGQERKICAIGVRCSRWVTMHGFALNVNTDLAYFDNIIPCGIHNKQVTSMQKELGYQVDMQQVKQKLKHHFGQIFQINFVEPSMPL